MFRTLRSKLMGAAIIVTWIASSGTHYAAARIGLPGQGSHASIRTGEGQSMPSAEEVGVAGYRAMMAGKHVVVPGLMNKLMAFPCASPRGVG